jgi:hypothetical protein
MSEKYFNDLINPFLIDIPDKESYDNEELVLIQEKLHEINIDALINDLYPENFRTPFELIKNRVKRGINQIIIDISNNLLPSKTLYKIGNGGDGKNCIVCSTSLHDNRYDLSQTIRSSLEEVGFNGHFYLFNGGFPNPTGIEMKYIGVPYTFKIFAMLEAQKLGFEKVIWIDSACYAVNNPEGLFDALYRTDALFKAFPANYFEPDKSICTYDHIIFPKTLDLLNKIVNRDIRNDMNVNSIVFGLNLSSPKINKFIEDYYDMVKIGLPFLSYFPEEIIFATLFNNPEFKYIFDNQHECNNLYIHEQHASKENAKAWNIFFIQRNH